MRVNLAQDIYSDAEVLDLLTQNRTVRYEYVVKDKNNKSIGMLTEAEGKISFDSSREVMRTCSIKAKKSELLDINSVDDRIVPFFCLLAPNGHWLRYPLGVFIINPSSVYSMRNEYLDVEGYDLGQIALTKKLENSVVYDAGVFYTSAINQRLGTMYSVINIENSTLTRPVEYEYEMGSTEISVVNDMLQAIDYTPLWFDELGAAHSSKYQYGFSRDVEMIYVAGKKSVVFDEVKRNNNLFDIPNRFIRYTDNPDMEPLRSVVTVTDPNVPSSTVSRGRIITDIAVVDDVATISELTSLTRRAAMNASRMNETIEFNTINMPHHGYKNCIQFRCDDSNIDGKYIETSWDMELSYNGKMNHKCSKVVSV